jgi:hypothetical protein
MDKAFACIAQIGIGSGGATGQAMVAALQPAINDPDDEYACNRGFLRQDALLVVTIIMDSYDQDSLGTADEWIEGLRAAKQYDDDAFMVLVLTTDIDLGGIQVRTLAYGNTVPGKTIRANVGDEIALALTNGLDHDTSVHWHGIALCNDMDGASPAGPDIGPGQRFTYRFSVPHAGTYWAHPHVGLDTDYGLYLPVIVDGPNEPTVAIPRHDPVQMVARKPSPSPTMSRTPNSTSAAPLRVIAADPGSAVVTSTSNAAYASATSAHTSWIASISAFENPT